MSLSEKSVEEISELLAEYGIKHGPIVDSTRKLYEKKLEKAMEATPLQASSDKTYYREEEEEVTYITYQSPVRHEPYGDVLKRRGNAEPEERRGIRPRSESRSLTKQPIHSASRIQEQPERAGGSMWKAIRLLVLLAVLAAVLYYAYCRVINNEDPFGIQ
ncbi:LOW QUALITY PROTEIN: uncharacterized protein emd [Morone saxatilis]|uniref:LOW QUALITY PROTEIN: uncharacterized protein emd n=1 Tax=Morone saxatilis TaxID=34816 RepID=UPI0015E1F625|nr:LOW QUALITY PROTEIN: uncharacterized protein emd [Morone saxatilis]